MGRAFSTWKGCLHADAMFTRSGEHQQHVVRLRDVAVTMFSTRRHGGLVARCFAAWRVASLGWQAERRRQHALHHDRGSRLRQVCCQSLCMWVVAIALD